LEIGSSRRSDYTRSLYTIPQFLSDRTNIESILQGARDIDPENIQVAQTCKSSSGLSRFHFFFRDVVQVKPLHCGCQIVVELSQIKKILETSLAILFERERKRDRATNCIVFGHRIAGWVHSQPAETFYKHFQ
jgi:hypothetical protein